MVLTKPFDTSFFSMSSFPRLTKQQLENAVLKFEERYQFKYRMSADEATMLYNTQNPVGGMVLSKHEFLFFMQNGLYTEGMVSAWTNHMKLVKADYAKFLRHSYSAAQNDNIYNRFWHKNDEHKGWRQGQGYNKGWCVPL